MHLCETFIPYLPLLEVEFYAVIRNSLFFHAQVLRNFMQLRPRRYVFIMNQKKTFVYLFSLRSAVSTRAVLCPVRELVNDLFLLLHQK